MHWTELAAIVVVAFAIIPVVMLVTYFCAIAWAGLRAWWLTEMPADLGREYSTDVGILVRGEQEWVGRAKHRGRPIAMMLGDVAGVPDQAALRQLPNVLCRLDELERIARESVPELTIEMPIDSVAVNSNDSEAGCDVTIGFSPVDQYDATLFVDMVDGKVVGWNWAD